MAYAVISLLFFLLTACRLGKAGSTRIVLDFLSCLVVGIVWPIIILYVLWGIIRRALK